MFVYPLPSILTHFQPILIENLSNPIRIKSKSIHFPYLGSLAGVIGPLAGTCERINISWSRVKRSGLKPPRLSPLEKWCSLTFHLVQKKMAISLIFVYPIHWRVRAPSGALIAIWGCWSHRWRHRLFPGNCARFSNSKKAVFQNCVSAKKIKKKKHNRGHIPKVGIFRTSQNKCTTNLSWSRVKRRGLKPPRLSPLEKGCFLTFHLVQKKAMAPLDPPRLAWVWFSELVQSQGWCHPNCWWVSDNWPMQVQGQFEINLK